MERGFGPGNLKMAANFWMSELLHWLVSFECLQQGLIKSDKMFYSIVFQIMLGIVMCKPSAEINMSKKLPRVVDYRDTHFSTPIKEQRECGACWAFAPTEVMEAMRFGFRSAKVEKIAKSLSVQHLIDCSGVSYGCKGGDVCDAMDYLIATDYQFVLEADYLPYSAVKHSTCQRQVTPSANITIGQSTCEDFSKSEVFCHSLLTMVPSSLPSMRQFGRTILEELLGTTATLVQKITQW
ncbi:cathepsin O-like isoform X2 [Varroa jacobsoni]|uniref:cathepsin O-like isoform X2 n=1 Tax=Varroa jacobsoni TaxID=62625 RepID=UPI000BF502FF|nr:cathepsin O-like isoform X2 [Varroa jacobsoni]